MNLFSRLASLKNNDERSIAENSTRIFGSDSPVSATTQTSDVVKAAELGGDEIQTIRGPFCRLIRPIPTKWPTPLSDQEILCNLQLIRGIGPVTEASLQAAGVDNLWHLTSHARFGDDAKNVLSLIQDRQISNLCRRGVRDIELLGLFKPEDVVFLDIETTGLWSSQPLFLVGTMRWIQGQMVLKQLLARHYREEAALLTYLAAELERSQVIITFNGKRFDWPYIRDRFIYYDLAHPTDIAHVDLYQNIRRLTLDVPNRKLVTLEQHLLGHTRDGDIPGHMVPMVYHQFAQAQEPDLIAPVLRHNAQDVITLAGLLPLISNCA